MAKDVDHSASRRVAFIHPLSTVRACRIASGIYDYAIGIQGNCRWELSAGLPLLHERRDLTPLEALRGWCGDGIIADIATIAEGNAAGRLRLPVVDWRPVEVLSAAGRAGFRTDRRGGSRAPAGAGLSPADVWGKGQRFCFERIQAGFLRLAEHRGAHAEIALFAHGSRCARPTAQVRQWLQKVRPPIGVLSGDDQDARLLVEECCRAGLGVPEDVGILGVGDNPSICETCSPTLSSVDDGAVAVGLEAARLLDRLMSGNSPSHREVTAPYPALGTAVVQRGSTGVPVLQDALVAAASEFVRDRTDEQYDVEDLARALGISHRRLGQRFREVLHCSPLEFIWQARVERAKQLLNLNDRQSLQSIAARCGFPTERTFRRVFKHLTGTTPQAFRHSRAARKAACTG